MEKGYKLIDNVIIIERDLNELDFFVRDFLKVLKRHSDYLVVSGYVSISTGRTRATEDVDILFPSIQEEKFRELFGELQKVGFWCYQGDDFDESYSYLKEMNSLRFARNNELFPNIELVPFNENKKAKTYEFEHFQKIRIDDFEFKIPLLEFEILYKEIVLSGKKDMDDARHLRTFFSDILSKERFKECREVIISETKDERKNKKTG